MIVQGHPYHPALLQWLTPRWGHLTHPSRHVTDVFVYRFRNIDPVNPPASLANHYFTGENHEIPPSIVIIIFIVMMTRRPSYGTQ